ncbi:MAG TPA: amino acid ABC transporter permease [Treponema sp.]|nr:amino acid ABC transporter permease [Treponema sp.]HPC70812.1 amino acid ABC transporter permease [Treponema sp.]HRS03159.1 amino acid ABC transporter permease [Treponema sp.]HRU28094.1 amino acid ABC transporter permease [Treponema sp.]
MKNRDFPCWLLLLGLLAAAIIVSAAVSADSRVIVAAIAQGLGVTISVSLIAYGTSILLGLVLGLLRASPFKPFRELATFYIEVVRGLPMLVILYYIAFVGAPALAAAINWCLRPFINLGWLAPVEVRSFNFTVRAVLALTLGYAAFIAEIFRAGIESVPRGQVEAAHALGLSHGQTLRKVVLPQAIRNVLPALANEFVAIVKDSSLVSALGVQDITQLGKVYSASTFKFFETYNVVAFFYLVITISLSLAVRSLEKRLKRRVHP